MIDLCLLFYYFIVYICVDILLMFNSLLVNNIIIELN